jgi:predicted nucleotidyltransferase
MQKMMQHHELAQWMANRFAQFESVQAVAISGSVMGGRGQENSDIDLYVIGSVPLEERKKLAAERGFTCADFNLNYWDPGDEWFDAPTGIEVDVMYWSKDWLGEQLEKVIDRHESAIGYTTCFWNTVRQAGILFDRDGWLTGLKEKAQAPYPEALRQAIVEKNYPLLHNIIPAYTHQLEKAIGRNDLVSVNHRLGAYLASYFDVLFAFNRVLHPGEKRLISFAQARCQQLPVGMAEDLEYLLAPHETPGEAWLQRLSHLNNALDDLLRVGGFG